MMVIVSCIGSNDKDDLLEEGDLEKVHRTLSGGGLVVFPTETVYGLAADPFNEAAVKRVFMVKNRPFDMPLSIAVSGIAMLERLAYLNEPSRRLVERFLPGPITLLLKKRQAVPDIVTYSSDLVGIRMPDHPIALQIIRRFGPLIATSANTHAHPDATCVKDAMDDLGDKIGIYVDSGSTALGKPSTIVLVEGKDVTLIRQGAISQEDIEGALNGRP